MSKYQHIKVPEGGQKITVNPDFSKVDISEIECRGGKGDRNEYCLAVAQVTNCFEAASEVKKLIHSIR